MLDLVGGVNVVNYFDGFTITDYGCLDSSRNALQCINLIYYNRLLCKALFMLG